MPDSNNLPISLQTGFDPSIDYAFQADTQARLSKIYANTDSPATPALKMPDTTIDSIARGQSSFDMNKAFLSGDQNQIRLANNAMENAVASDHEYMQGVNSPKFFDYSKSLNKYIQGDLGYDPTKSIAQNEDKYYNESSAGGNWLKFIGRTVGGAVLKLGETGAFALSAINPLNFGSDYTTKVADNGLSRYLEGAEQTFKDTWLPVYHQLDYDKTGIFSKALKSDWWADSASDGFAYALSAVVPGVGFGKLAGGGAELASILGKTGGAIAKVATGAENLGGVGAWAFNTATEAFTEAAQGVQDYRTEQEQLRREGKNNKTDAQIQDEAGKIASGVFGWNLAILALPNAFENSMIYGKLVRGERQAAKSTISKLVSIGEDAKATAKELPKSFLGRNFGSAARIGFYGKIGLEAVGVEGLWEENAQTALQRVQSGKSNLNFFHQLFSQTVDAFKGEDPEVAESIALGGIIGIAGTGVGAKFAKERRSLINNYSEAKGVAASINNARQGAFSMDGIYQTDDAGNVKFDDNKEPIVNPVAVKLKAAILNTHVNMRQAVEEIQDPDLKQLMQKEMFKHYVEENIKSGTFDKMYNRIAALDSKSDDELRALGLDPEVKLNTSEGLAEYTKEIYNAHIAAQSIEETKDLVNTEAAKKTVFDFLVQNYNLRQYKSNLITKDAQYKASIRTLDNSTLSDTYADQWNHMTFKINALKQVDTETPSDFTKSQIEEVQSQRQDLQDSFGENLKGISKTPDDYYINDKQVYHPQYVDMLFNQKRNAEIENTITHNEHAIAQAASPKTRAEYLNQTQTPLINNIVSDLPVRPATVVVTPARTAPVVVPGDTATEEDTPHDAVEQTPEVTDVVEPKTNISPEEYEQFVDTGETTDDVLEYLANKIENNEPLSDEESSIYASNTDKVEEKVKERQARASATPRTPELVGKVNYEYQPGKVAYKTPLKSTTQEVIRNGNEEFDDSDPYQSWIQSYLTSRMQNEVSIYPNTDGKYKMHYMPDQQEWHYNKSPNYQGLLSAVMVVTDQQGNPVYFDQDYNETTKELGRVISYSADVNFKRKDINKKIEAAKKHGMIINGKTAFIKYSDVIRNEFYRINDELNARKNDIINSKTPQEIVVTTIEKNNNVPTGKMRSANEVFGEKPKMRIVGRSLVMEVQGHEFPVTPILTRENKEFSGSLADVYQHKFDDKKQAERAASYLALALPITKQGIQSISVVEKEGKYAINAKFSGAIANSAKFRSLLIGRNTTAVLFSVKNKNMKDQISVFSIKDGKVVEDKTSYENFLSDKFKTNLVGTKNAEGFSYRPLNAYFNFEFADNLNKELPNTEPAQTPDAQPEEVKPKTKRVVKPAETNDVKQINLAVTPSAPIIKAMQKLADESAKMAYLTSRGILTSINVGDTKSNQVIAGGQVMVLAKIGQYNIPFYLDNKTSKWLPSYGLGENLFINKAGADFPIFNKISNILNDGLGVTDGATAKTIDSPAQINQQMNLPTNPVNSDTDTQGFLAHANSTLKLLNAEIKTLSPKKENVTGTPQNKIAKLQALKNDAVENTVVSGIAGTTTLVKIANDPDTQFFDLNKNKVAFVDKANRAFIIDRSVKDENNKYTAQVVEAKEGAFEGQDELNKQVKAAQNAPIDLRAASRDISGAEVVAQGPAIVNTPRVETPKTPEPPSTEKTKKGAKEAAREGVQKTAQEKKEQAALNKKAKGFDMTLDYSPVVATNKNFFSVYLDPKVRAELAGFKRTDVAIAARVLYARQRNSGNNSVALDLTGKTAEQILGQAGVKEGAKDYTLEQAYQTFIPRDILPDGTERQRLKPTDKPSKETDFRPLSVNTGQKDISFKVYTDKDVKTVMLYSPELKEAMRNLFIEQVNKGNLDNTIDLRGLSPLDIVEQSKIREQRSDGSSNRYTLTEAAENILLLQNSIKNLFGRHIDVISDPEVIDELVRNIPRLQQKSGKGTSMMGFLMNGTIYIDPRRADGSTPLHEFSHIWNDIIRDQYPDFYAQGLKLVEGTEYEKEARELYPDLAEEDLMEEALVRAITDKGMKTSLTQGLLDWLKGIWQWVSGKLGLGVSAEELQNMTLDEYANIVSSSLLYGNELDTDPFPLDDTEKFERLQGMNPNMTEEAVSDALDEAKLLVEAAPEGMYKLILTMGLENGLKDVAFQARQGDVTRGETAKIAGMRLVEIAEELYPYEGPENPGEIKFQLANDTESTEDLNEETDKINPVSDRTKQVNLDSFQQLTSIVEQNDLYDSISDMLKNMYDAAKRLTGESDKVKASKGRILSSLQNVQDNEGKIRATVSAIKTTNDVLADMYNNFSNAVKLSDPNEKMVATFAIYKSAKSFEDVIDLIREVREELTRTEGADFVNNHLTLSKMLNEGIGHYENIQKGFLKALLPGFAETLAQTSDLYKEVSRQHKEANDKIAELQTKKSQTASIRDKANIDNQIKRWNNIIVKLPTKENLEAALKGNGEDINSLVYSVVSRADSTSTLVQSVQALASKSSFMASQDTQKFANQVNTFYNKLKNSLGFSNYDPEKNFKPIVRQVALTTGFKDDGTAITQEQDILLNEATSKFFEDYDRLRKETYFYGEKLGREQNADKKTEYKRKYEQAQLNLDDFIFKYTDTKLPAEHFEINKLLKEDIGGERSVNDLTKGIFDRLAALNKQNQNSDFQAGIKSDSSLSNYLTRELDNYLAGIKEPQDSLEYKIAARLQRALDLREAIGEYSLSDSAATSYDDSKKWTIKKFKNDNKVEVIDGIAQDGTYRLFNWIQKNSNLNNDLNTTNLIEAFDKIQSAQATATKYSDAFLQVKDVTDSGKDANGMVNGNRFTDAELANIKKLDETLNPAFENLDDLTFIPTTYYTDALRDKTNEWVETNKANYTSEEEARLAAPEGVKETQWYVDNHLDGKPTSAWVSYFSLKDSSTNAFEAGRGYYGYELYDQYNAKGRTQINGSVYLNSDPNNQYIDKDYAKLQKGATKEDAAYRDFLKEYTDFYFDKQKNYKESSQISYLLPSMRRGHHERNADFLKHPIESIKGKIADMKTTDQEREEMYGQTNVNGVEEAKPFSELERIPVRLSSPIDTKDQSKDIIGSMLMYSHYANKYKHMQKIEPILVGARDMIEANGTIKTSNSKRGLMNAITGLYGKIKGQPVNEGKDKAKRNAGEDSNVAKQLDILVKEELYGKYNEEFEIPLLGGIDGNNLVRNTMKLSSWGSFVGNLYSPLKNSIGGRIQSIIFARAEKEGHYTFADTVKAKMEFVKHQGDFAKDFSQFGDKSLVGQILDKLNLLQGEITNEFGTKTQFTAGKFFATGNFMLFFKNYAEFQIQTEQALAFLIAKKVKTTDGKMISLLDAYEKDPATGFIKTKDNVILDADEEYGFSQKVHKYQRMLNGAYRASERNTLQREPWGKLLFFMNQYFVPMFNARFRPEYYNVQLGGVEEGFHATTAKFLTKSLIDYRGKFSEAWGDMTPEQRANVFRTVKELAITGTLALAAMALGYGKGSDAKKKNSDAENYILALLIGSYSEARSFIVPSDYYNKTNNLFFAFRPVGTVLKLLNDGTSRIAGSDSAYFNKDSGYWKKGDTKATADFFRLIGFTGTQLQPKQFATNVETSLKLRN